MCSTSQTNSSRTQISAPTQSSCFLPVIKRKQGVCLITNPVLQAYQDQEQLPAARSSTGLDHFRSLGSRPVCEFLTFKGSTSSHTSQHNNTSDLKPEQDREVEIMAVPTDEDRARYGSVRKASCGNFRAKMAARDQFQTVNLNGVDEKDKEKDKENKERQEEKEKEPQPNNHVQQLDATNLPPPPEANDKIVLAEFRASDDDALKPPFPFAGIIGNMMSAFFFSLSILCVKLMPDSDSLQEKTKAVWFRGFFFAGLSALTMIAQGTTFKVKRDEIWVNFVRTFVGFFGSFGAYTSLQYITVGESTALIYLSIFWTAILSYFVLKEPFPITLTVAIPMAMFGIVMIAHPDLIIDESTVVSEVLTEVQRHNHQLMLNNTRFKVKSALNDSIVTASQSLLQRPVEIISNITTTASSIANDIVEVDPDLEAKLYFEKRWPGIVIATATSVVVSIVFVVLKYRKSTPIQTCTFYLGVGVMIMAGAIHCFIGFGRWPDTYEWVILFSMGACSWSGQALMQWSLQYEKASVLGIVRTVDMVLAFCWSTWFLDEDILWTSIVGGAIILVIVVILMLNDRIEKLVCLAFRKR